MNVAYGGGRSARTASCSTRRATRAPSSQRLIAIMDLATGVAHFLSREPKWDVDDFALSHDGKTLAYVTNEDGIERPALCSIRRTGASRHAAEACRSASWRAALAPRRPTTWGYVVSSPARAPTSARSTSKTGKRRALDRERDRRARSRRPSPSRSWSTGRASTGATISGFLYQPAAKFTGKRPVIIDIHGGPEGQSRPGFLGRSELLHQRAGRRDRSSPTSAARPGYGKTFLALDNGVHARGRLQGHRRAARLDRDAARPRRGSRHGHRRQLRRPHDPRRRDALQPTGSAAPSTSSGIVQPRDVPGAHARLSPRPAPRRVRRRARPDDPRVPGADRSAEPRRQDHEAPLRRPGRERPARASDRGRPDGRDGSTSTARRSGTSWPTTRDTASPRRRTGIFSFTRRSNS